MKMTEALDRKGLLLGLSCYLIWGLVPLYFKLLGTVSAWEVVGHRILWSIVLLLTMIAARGRLGAFAALFRNRALRAKLALSAVLIAANWLVYIWAIANHHLLATSLGYFLNPLLNVVLGVFVLKERLGRAQRIAVGIAAAGVLVALFGSSSEVWISISLALTFALYGLVRKATDVNAIEGLAIETALLAPIAAAGLYWLSAHGGLMFGRAHHIDALLMLSAGVTAFPLILFAAAARRLPYSTLGILQYIAPSLQFLSALFLYHESLHPHMLVAFILIWIALGIFTFDLLQRMASAGRPVMPLHEGNK